MLKWSIPQEKAMPASGVGRSRETPVPCRCLPRKSNFAAIMSTSSFRVPEVFGSPSCSRAPFWKENVQNSGKQSSWEHKDASVFKTWIHIWGYRQLWFQWQEVRPHVKTVWTGTFLGIFVVTIWAGSQITQNPNSSDHVWCLQESREGWLK